MANTVENIYVEYGADTKDFIQAQKGVNKSINSTTKYLNHLDKGFSDAYSTEDIEKALRSMQDVTREVQKNEKVLKDAEFILDQYAQGLIDLSPMELANVTEQANKSRIAIDQANNSLDRMQSKLVTLDSSKFDELTRDAQQSAIAVGVLDKQLDKVDGRVVVASVKVEGDKEGDGGLDGKLLQSLPKVIKGIAIALAAWTIASLLAFKANVLLAKGTNAAASAMFNLETGILNAGLASAETLPEVTKDTLGMSLAFKLGGASASGFAQGLLTLLTNVATAPEMFKAMGIEVNTNNGYLEEAKRILPEVVEYFNAMDPSLNKAIQMSAVFGSTFSDVNYVMMTGADEIRKTAEEISLLIDEEDIAALVEYKQNMNEVKIAAIDLATDGLAEAATGMTEYIEETRKAIESGDKQINTFRDLLKEYKHMIQDQQELRTQTRELADATEDGNIRFMEQHRLLKDVRQESGLMSEEYDNMKTKLSHYDVEIGRSNDLLGINIEAHNEQFDILSDLEIQLGRNTQAQNDYNASIASQPSGGGGSSSGVSANALGVNMQSLSPQTSLLVPNQQKTFNISNLVVNSNVSDMDRFIPELTIAIDEYASRIGG